MAKYKFPISTFGRYIPGVGITLTRANVERIQKERVADGKEPLTAEQMVDYCKPSGVELKPMQEKESRSGHRRRQRLVDRGEKVCKPPVEDEIQKYRKAKAKRMAQALTS